MPYAFLVVCLMLWPLLAAPAGAQPLPLLSGTLTCAGSDTLGNIMTGWAADLSRRYPAVSVQIQAAGSATAATALAAGTTQIGPMSRDMTAPERAAFIQRYHYPPLAVPVALDAVVIVVNQDNPLDALPLGQLDALFSVTHRCGAAPAVTRWGQLGLTGGWANKTMLRYGRNSASGTYGFFRQRALCGGDTLPAVNELPGSAAVAQAVAASVNAIGYASMGFHASGVKIVALEDDQGRRILPEADRLRNGDYPLTRYLYLYVNKAPDKPLEPLTSAFLDQALSPEGQRRVQAGGYLPLPDAVRRQARRSLGLD